MRRILVLENYRPTSQALALTLQRAGWEVDLVATERDALTALARRIHSMLLMDLDISTGDSWRVLEFLQGTQNVIPVIALLGSGESGHVHAQTWGIRTILPKPVGRVTLLAAVRAILSSASEHGDAFSVSPSSPLPGLW
jgi:two-component system OmpR family response regulator